MLILYYGIIYLEMLCRVSVLKEVDKCILIPIIEIAISEAFNSSDFMWLAGIKYFLDIAGYIKSDFVNVNVYDLLKYAD